MGEEGGGAKQMRKIMYTRALFILHKNRRTLTFSRRHRLRNFLFTLKRKSFPDLENAEHLDHCSFCTQTENLVLSYSTLTILLFSCHLYSPCFRMILLNQLMQQCTARTTWSDSVIRSETSLITESDRSGPIR